ncbi:hypothetical protein BDR26DRAFT_1014436 [Obelidium mucronatum]|nr:hypothetical protein BDR26DRAFT_1014436 [Obelidium mucronatum]
MMLWPQRHCFIPPFLKEMGFLAKHRLRKKTLTTWVVSCGGLFLRNWRADSGELVFPRTWTLAICWIDETKTETAAAAANLFALGAVKNNVSRVQLSGLTKKYLPRLAVYCVIVGNLNGLRVVVDLGGTVKSLKGAEEAAIKRCDLLAYELLLNHFAQLLLNQYVPEAAKSNEREWRVQWCIRAGHLDLFAERGLLPLLQVLLDRPEIQCVLRPSHFDHLRILALRRQQSRVLDKYPTQMTFNELKLWFFHPIMENKFWNLLNVATQNDDRRTIQIVEGVLRFGWIMATFLRAYPVPSTSHAITHTSLSGGKYHVATASALSYLPFLRQYMAALRNGTE